MLARASVCICPFDQVHFHLWYSCQNTLACEIDGLYTYEGSDEPDVSDGRPSGNILTSNLVEDCPIGVKIKEGDDNSFYGKLCMTVSAKFCTTPFILEMIAFYSVEASLLALSVEGIVSSTAPAVLLLGGLLSVVVAGRTYILHPFVLCASLHFQTTPSST